VVQWRSKFDPSFQISVNKSPVQIRYDGNNHISWSAYLRERNIPGQSIAVEITEGLLLHAEADVKGKLLGFRDAGIQVAIDDFGTGYSSLAYLKKFDIDYLKIDRSFVCNLGTNRDDLALCEAMIIMAHKLGLRVVAEGVETMEQRDLLLAAGCDYGQGYLYSRPVPPAEFEKLLGQ
jgi:EAL domain-containing protein (putative c-di-GMP-specific phosphodiesterase class I)